MEAVISIREAARMLGVGHQGFYPLVQLLRVETKPHPSNARAKALTVKQVATLREAIEAGRRVVAQSA